MTLPRCAAVLISLGCAMALAVPAHAADAQAALFPSTQLPFYVYQTYQSSKNHYSPSGWMGDYGDIRFTDRHIDKESHSKKVIRIQYTAKASQRNGWTGIYWQNPANNWGSRAGGYNLNGAKQMVFLAKGEKGGETVSQFKIGGITGDYSDSGSAAIGPIALTKNWKEYKINLDGMELSSISGGFCWTMTRDENPEGAVFYLDNIRFE